MLLEAVFLQWPQSTRPERDHEQDTFEILNASDEQLRLLCRGLEYPMLLIL